MHMEIDGSDTSEIYFDLTDTLLYFARCKRVSGIQRVVITVLQELLASPSFRERVVPVAFDWRRRSFVEIPKAKLFEIGPDGAIVSLRTQALSHFGKFLFPRMPQRAKYEGKPVRYRLHVFRRLVPFYMRSGWASFTSEKLRTISLPKGASLLLMGSGWDTQHFLPHMTALKSIGLRLVFFIHDIMPLVLPLEQTTVNVPMYRSWFDKVLTLADRILVCSIHTNKDVQNYIKAQDAREVEIVHVPLAHEFLQGSQQQYPAVKSDETLTKPLNSKRYLLFVGPASGRKNAQAVITAWAKLEKHPDFAGLHLCIAGATTAQEGSEILKSMGLSSEGQRIVFQHAPTDQALSALYRHCLFTVFPSSYEGWGLPVGESLWFGKYCIAASGTTLEEVGATYCDYVEPGDVNALASAMEKAVTDRDYLQRKEQEIASAKLRSWAQVAKEIGEASLSKATPEGNTTTPKRKAAVLL
ncbi:glycosyltransferase [Polycladidibacter hongkongensis]|uniref:glycosyltransferase n=1 Tax=Polycladidibacter hongkongensis TaxID=1647556 RepID=UPI0008297F95|nr:glycosyltransferase [Pseudovibrio hongkongensis]